MEDPKSLINAKRRDASEAVVFFLEVLSQGLKFSGVGQVLGLWISTEAGGQNSSRNLSFPGQSASVETKLVALEEPGGTIPARTTAVEGA